MCSVHFVAICVLAKVKVKVDIGFILKECLDILCKNCTHKDIHRQTQCMYLQVFVHLNVHSVCVDSGDVHTHIFIQYLCSESDILILLGTLIGANVEPLSQRLFRHADNEPFMRPSVFALNNNLGTYMSRSINVECQAAFSCLN